MKAHRKIVVVVILSLAGLYTVAEGVAFVKSFIPSWLTSINSQPIVLLLLIGLCLYLLFSREATDNPQTINTPTSIGNQVQQHFHFEGVSIDNLAGAIADKLKAGDRTGISADDERAEPYVTATDGFVQLEKIDMQVPTAELAVGQIVSAKYTYANRGVCPVYEVKTWGLMQVLDPLLNSAQHLKAVMRVAAQDGQRMFPGGATLGVQLDAHAFAPLSEPFSENQLEGLKDKSLALFVLVGGVWVDNRGVPRYWATCHRVDFFSTVLTWNSFALANL